MQQREIERACEVAVQALDLPSDQRIGPIDQRARDLLRELAPWHATRPSPSWLTGWQLDEHGRFFRARMRAYLDAMDEAAAAFRAVKPATAPPRVLAALGPKMLDLAAERANGAHTYLVTPEHTAKARAQLGRRRGL